MAAATAFGERSVQIVYEKGVSCFIYKLFISWAFLDEPSEKRMFQNGGKLRPDDWKSGDRLWIIDIVAPFGGVENMLMDIQKNEFPDQVVRLIAPDPKTGGITARELPPYDSSKMNGGGK